jgi:hypothetical protein
VTDIGIELGKLVYWNSPDRQLPLVRANPTRLRLLLQLAIGFFCGGVIGALGFKLVGYLATVPLALLLVALAGVPTLDDLSRLWRKR